jgi:hypothetical protein
MYCLHPQDRRLSKTSRLPVCFLVDSSFSHSSTLKINQLGGAESFLRNRQSFSHSRISQHSRHPKVHYRVHKIPPLVPIESTPPHYIPLRSILILSSHVYIFLVVSFFLSSPPNLSIHSFSLPRVLHAIRVNPEDGGSIIIL